MTAHSLRLVVAAGLIVAAAGCGDDDAGRAGDTASSSSAPTAETEPVVESSAPESSAPPGAGDGVLTIGVLLPQSGDGNSLGNVGIAAASVAVRRINEAEGVFNDQVNLVVANEGATVEDARRGIAELLDQDVDAIIGPGSSIVALETLDELTEAGVVTCSPLASTMALNHYPDRDLFFRTIPSDSVIARAMASVVVRTGVSSATVVYLDDDYGRPLARLTIEQLGVLGIDEVDELPFSAHDDDLADDVLQLAESPTSSVVIVADSAQGWRMLSAIADEFGSDPPDNIIVNAPMRQTTSPAVVQDLTNEFRMAIQGVSPSAAPPGPNRDEDLNGNYSVNSYDCVNLIALAAVAAGSDSPRSMADQMVGVSSVGQGCQTFTDCVGFLDDDLNIDYEGPINAIDLSARGDPSRGRLEPFKFDERGVDVPAGGALSMTDPVE